jgi:hypothetical protein
MTRVVFMKDHGLQTKGTEEDSNYFQMEINIKVNIRMEKLMVKEHILGEIMKYMMENGRVDKKMATVFGRESKETVILDNGKIAKLRDMEFTHG